MQNSLKIFLVLMFVVLLGNDAYSLHPYLGVGDDWYYTDDLDISSVDVIFHDEIKPMTVDINGGDIDGVSVLESATLKINNGNFANWVEVLGSATAHIYNGNITHVYPTDFSTTNIFGGSIGSILSVDSSEINLYGGDITTFNMFESSIVNVYGYEFNFDGMNLTGFWQGGEAFSINWYAEDNDNLNLITIPEPATMLLLGSGGFLLRKKK